MKRIINILLLLLIFSGLSIAPASGGELHSFAEEEDMDNTRGNTITDEQVLNSIAETEEEANAKLANKLSTEQVKADQEKQRLERSANHKQIMKAHEDKVNTEMNNTISRLEFDNIGVNQYSGDLTILSSTIGNGGNDANIADDTAHFITKEGTYFAKMSYSKIIFEAPLDLSGNYYLVTKISRINDIYLRLFNVYVNGVNKYSGYVGYGSSILDIYIGDVDSGDKIALQINWGAYADQGWLLEYAYLDQNDETPEAFSGQYFPKEYYSEIETKFIGGEDVRLDFDLDRVNDPFSRFLSIYVDGVLKHSEFVVGANGVTLTNKDLGDYSRRTVHTLTFRIRSGGYSETGWRLNWIRIGYLALHVEVDWMSGHEPDASVFSEVSLYYHQNGYERVKFYKSEYPVPFEDEISGDRLEGFYGAYNWVNAAYPNNHRYLLWGRYGEGGLFQGGFSLTYTVTNDPNTYFRPFFFIAEKAIDNTFSIGNSEINKQIMVVKHELGHTLTLLKKDGSDEFYDWGNRDTSVMNNMQFWGENAGDDAHYSYWGWSGDGKWWELRQGFYVPYDPDRDNSVNFKLTSLITV